MVLLLTLAETTRDSLPEILRDLDQLGRFLWNAGLLGASTLVLVAGVRILDGELRLASRQWLLRHWMPLAATACFIVAAICVAILSRMPSWADGFNP